jgi:tRNA (guanine-N1)-methyltransferase
MQIFIITPFPDVINSFMHNSMIKKAQNCEIINYEVLNLFDYADKPHRNIDDYPFGGGSGMVMKPEPIFRAFDDIKNTFKSNFKNVIYPTPDGQVFNQSEAKKFKKCESLIFICGHYKGIDQRVRDNLVTHEYSIGDYIITGGELSSLVILDSIIRLIPGVLNNIESANTDSFESKLLDSNYYPKREIYRTLKVPETQIGNHQKIEERNKTETK